MSTAFYILAFLSLLMGVIATFFEDWPWARFFILMSFMNLVLGGIYIG